MIDDSALDRCPLCRARDHVAVDRVAYRDVWKQLTEDFDTHFSAEVIARNTPAPEALLMQCLGCGLRFFVPVHPGDADFYKQLMRDVPYLHHRWDFQVVAGAITSGQRVLDLGCGTGIFLRKVTPVAGETVGVDINPDVQARAEPGGVTIYHQSFQAFAASHPRAFDVVCSFQVVEHMDNVAALIGPAAMCLRPDGRLFLSVPNRHRRRSTGLEPLDCPPHHVSQWGPDQLEALAPRFGLRLRRLYFEPPFYGPPSWEAPAAGIDRAGMRNRLALLLRDHIYARPSLRKVLEGAWYGRRGVVGHGLLGEFQLSADPAPEGGPTKTDEGLGSDIVG